MIIQGFSAKSTSLFCYICQYLNCSFYISDEIIHSIDYIDWSVFIFNKIKHAQTQTAFKVNSEMLTLY